MPDEDDLGRHGGGGLVVVVVVVGEIHSLIHVASLFVRLGGCYSVPLNHSEHKKSSYKCRFSPENAKSYPIEIRKPPYSSSKYSLNIIQ